LPVQGVEVLVNISHTHVGDLRLTLISPSGIQVQLLNRQGSNSQHLVNTLFDEYSDSSVPTGANLSGGAYKPGESLSSLYRSDPNGTWTLRVEDLAYGDVGTFNSFSLRLITTNEATTVTSGLGFYTMASAAAGNYNLRSAPIEPGWSVVNPIGGVRMPSLISGSAVNGQNFVLERSATESARIAVPLRVLPPAPTTSMTDSLGMTYTMIAVPPLDLVEDVASASQNGNRASNRRVINM
jgi:subtilisin-like proprotein convertase family protein